MNLKQLGYFVRVAEFGSFSKAAMVLRVAQPALSRQVRVLETRVSFEDVVFHIEAGDEIDLFRHPNQERYPGQKISVVLIEGYAYLVPFVESETEILLKTIIPSCKATKHYIGESDE